MDYGHWESKSSLKTLLHRVRRERKKGKSFRGHGTWYKYLEQEHGINSLTAMEGTYHEQTHNLVEKEIQKGTQMDAGYWDEHSRLRNLYSRVRNQTIRGKRFAGHGSWAEYLKERHNISMLTAPPGTYPERDTNIIQRAIESGAPIDKGNFSEELNRLYGRLSITKVNGKTFAGYGGWLKYLAGEFRDSLAKRVFRPIANSPGKGTRKIAQETGLTPRLVNQIVQSNPERFIAFTIFETEGNIVFNPRDIKKAIERVEEALKKARSRQVKHRLNRIKIKLAEGKTGVLE